MLARLDQMVETPARNSDDGLGRIDIQRDQSMAAAMCMKAGKYMSRRS